MKKWNVSVCICDVESEKCRSGVVVSLTQNSLFFPHSPSTIFSLSTCLAPALLDNWISLVSRGSALFELSGKVKGGGAIACQS